jgi:ferredoxin
MPKLKVEGAGTFQVPQDKRLVLALEDEVAINQLHTCGGKARCTTCRVEFITGEPKKMTQAERQVLAKKGLLNEPGLRLSCQILCDHDMEVRASSRLEGRPYPALVVWASLVE